MNFSSLKEFCIKNNIDFNYKNVVNSTMDFAKNHNSNINSIYICNKQNSGRGRPGNKWLGESGNIFFTLKLFPNKQLHDFFIIGLLACMQIKDVINQYNIKEVYLKWPNDIYIKDNKVGGVIIETFETFCLVGIGINLISSPKIIDKKTTFLKKYNKMIEIDSFMINFLMLFINSYLKWNNNINFKFINEYKKSLMYINKMIRIKNYQNNIITGKFIDINQNGHLILEINNKTIIVPSGSIELA